jgi:hypothetical protein
MRPDRASTSLLEGKQECRFCKLVIIPDMILRDGNDFGPMLNQKMHGSSGETHGRLRLSKAPGK